MPTWVLYAFASMVFAGLTAVIAKPGLAGISADLGLALRTAFMFAFVMMIAAATVPVAEIGGVTSRNVAWLAASALTASASWICYYRAIKLGEVSTVALIDKGSVLIAVLASWWFLGEPVTTTKLAGGFLVLLGLVVIAMG